MNKYTKEKTNEIKVLDKGFVRLDEVLGSDIKTVNSARVSFSAESQYVTEDKFHALKHSLDNLNKEEFLSRYPEDKYTTEYIEYFKFTNHSNLLKPKDFKLLKYLIKEKHHSPLRHSYITFHVKLPLAINAQWIKHQVGCGYSGEGWNQISHRYIDGTKEATKFDFYFPDGFRRQSSDNRQASLDEKVYPILDDTEWGNYIEYSREIDENGANVAYAVDALDVMKAISHETFFLYETLVKLGVAKEQARMILPQNVYTEVYWTCSLQAVLNFISLRKHNGAQYEIRKYAEAIEELLKPYFPATMYLWERYGK